MSARHLVRRWAALALGAVLSSPAHAEVDVRALARAVPLTSALPDTSMLAAPALSAVIELGDGDDGAAWGLPRLGSHFSALHAPLADLDVLARLHPSWRITWSAPLHPLLDRAAGWARAPSYRNATGFTGQGVVVGVVDTGIDAEHADFRNADGSTRIAYLIDFSRDPLGKHPDAEARCTAAKLRCAVLSAADIDAANTSGKGDDLPSDSVGHGTHVASLAAGNGGREAKYVGIAPEATLIVARAINGAAGINDDSVLVSTDLVFFLAEEEGKKRGLSRLPAVVNLSLGSDWGPHDGSTPLERGLADFVGDDHPGRAIVVAAGNSAGLYGGSTTYPDPLGIHTDVSVPDRGTVSVPIVVPPVPHVSGDLSARILVWIDFRPEDDVSVALTKSGFSWIPAQPRGAGGTFGAKPLVATIVNGALGRLSSGAPSGNAAAVIIEGTFAPGTTFSIQLEGHGTARFWVQSEGDLGPGAGSLGALLPGATRESTVTIPAASPALIAVGVTLNRTTWTDRVGNPQQISSLGPVRHPPLDSVPYFSSAGPTSDLRMKPDLLAPGGFVAGAMSRDADPATNGRSVFAENPFCTPLADCIAVDDTHAVTLGTSMASPLVAGAVALLFQGDPTLTESRIRTLLQAGARHPEGLVPLGAQLGAGGLDLDGVLDVQHQQQTGAAPPRRPVSRESWLTLGATYAHPDPTFAVPAVLQLRDSNGRATLIDPAKLSITADPGAVTTTEVAAPGLVRFAVAANRDTGGETLTVEARYDGALIAEQALPIAVDVNVVRSGFWARGGCAIAREGAERSGSNGEALGASMLVTLATLARRLRAPGRRASSCTRGARRARSRDRTGTWAPARRGSFPR